MIRIALLAGLALAVAACAPKPPPAGPTEGLDWFFLSDGDTGKLAYGVPASDEILLELECRKADPDVVVSRPAPAGAAPEIVLSAEGMDPTRLTASATPSQTHDGVDLNASAPLAAPLFSAFRESGWLGVKIGADVRRYAAQPRGEAIERFFTWCGP